MMRPLNVSIPGMSGVRGWDRKPVAAMRNCVAQRLTTGERDPPDLRIVVPPGTFDGGVEPHVAAHVVLVGHMLGVALQFGTRRNSRDQYGFGSNQ